MRNKKSWTKKEILMLFFLCLSIIGFVGLFVIFSKANNINQTDEPQNSIEKINSQSKQSQNSQNIVEIEDNESGSRLDEQNITTVDNITSKVVIRMVGDSLIHEPVANSGLKSDGSYNYDHLFENIKDDISEADLAIINQETVLGGTALGITGYPRFNSPQEIGDSIVNSGFNVVQHANNHAMDKELYGMEATMEYWDKHPEITVVGVSRSEQERLEPKVVEINGIRIAILSYTTSLNGLPLPSGKPWLVHMLNQDEVVRDIEKAKEMSDFIVVLPHWGVEYSYEVSAEQTRMAKVMIDSGADLIIGTHPHVLEPIEWINRQDGGKGLVYYSLGNYVSNQSRPARMLGGMAEITIEKQGDNVIISDAGIVPLVTHYEWGNLQNSYKVYKLEEYNDQLAAKNGVLLQEFDDNGQAIQKTFNMAWLNDLAKQVLGDWYK